MSWRRTRDRGGGRCSPSVGARRAAARATAARRRRRTRRAAKRRRRRRAPRRCQKRKCVDVPRRQHGGRDEAARRSHHRRSRRALSAEPHARHRDRPRRSERTRTPRRRATRTTCSPARSARASTRTTRALPADEALRGHDRLRGVLDREVSPLAAAGEAEDPAQRLPSSEDEGRATGPDPERDERATRSRSHRQRPREMALAR